MTNTPKFEFKRILSATEKLRKRLLSGLSASGDEDVQKLAADVPPSNTSEGDKPPLSIAFVGQYNAGKSTLIKSLTGRDDVTIDSDVCTDQVQGYDWEGIRILDTPGVHAGLPTHDEMTEKQIAKSDLLIFVITAELFGDDIAPYFRDLAFTRSRAAEMMLVVNKIDQDTGDNEVKRADIELVTSPLTMEEFRTSFVSGELFLEGLGENDPDSQAALIHQSGMKSFVAAMDAFCREQGNLGALTTPLYTIREVALQAASMSSTDASEERKGIELLGRRSKIFRESRARLSATFRSLLNQCIADLSAFGDGAAGSIDPSNTQKDIEESMSRSREQSKERIEHLKLEMTNAIKAEMDTLRSDLKRLAEGILAENLSAIIEHPAELPQVDPHNKFDGPLPKSRLDPAYAANLKKLGDISKGIGQWMVKFTQGAKGTSGWNTAAAAGSKAHTLIYDVGKYFGYSFKPWEAVGMASKLGNAAKFLGPIAAIMQVAGQILEEHLEESQRLEFQKARSETRALYLGNANSVRLTFAKEFEEFLDDFYGPPMKENDRLMDDLQGSKSKRESEQKLFNVISTETLSLIQDIRTSDV